MKGCINLKYYVEPAREIPVTEETDVLVIGAGPAGFSAAVAAARNGAKTTLIEQTGTVGGIATSGLMSHWAGWVDGGIFHEILDRSNDIENMNTNLPDSGVDGNQLERIINHEKLKAVMLQMLRESGARLRLYTFACNVIMENNKIAGVITESKSGREAFTGKVIIDATGDGDIAAKAGVPFIKGREDDGRMQPMTLMFKVGGVDEARVKFVGGFETTYEVPKGDLQTLAKNVLPYPAGHILIYRTSLPGVVCCNMTNCIGVDGTNADDLTHAEYTCRFQIEPIVEFLRNYVPGFEKCYVLTSASLMGVRETRHFEGEYTLTEKDILEARVFDDWVVTNAHFGFDVHNITGSGLDKTGAQKHFPQNKGYTIPYRCLLPKKVDGLLLAGRNISGTHMAHSSYRVMPICANIGYAAGTAAAICVKDKIEPRNMDVKKLQDMLKKA